MDDGDSVASDGAPLREPIPPGALAALVAAGRSGGLPLEEISRRMVRATMTHARIRQRAEGQFLQYGGAVPATTGAEAPDESALHGPGEAVSMGRGGHPGLTGADRGPSAETLSDGRSVASAGSATTSAGMGTTTTH